MGSVPICVLPIFLLLAGCAVGNPNYPGRWPVLGLPPAPDCARYAGRYADRGETPDGFGQVSFTRELFGYRPAWEEATLVELGAPMQGMLEVTVWAGERALFKRVLYASEGEFACEAGRLVIHSKRWAVENLVAGHENATLALHTEAGYLVVRVKELAYALAFVVVPFIADATHWYRFERLAAKQGP